MVYLEDILLQVRGPVNFVTKGGRKHLNVSTLSTAYESPAYLEGLQLMIDLNAVVSILCISKIRDGEGGKTQYCLARISANSNSSSTLS